MWRKTSIYLNKCLYKHISTYSINTTFKADTLKHVLYFKLGNDFFQIFKNANVFVNSVISNVFAVSLPLNIIARFVSLLSVKVDMWNVLISFNLPKFRSAVGYCVKQWSAKFPYDGPKLLFHGRPQKFFQGSNVNILLILFKSLTMQCKRTFTKRFTLSRPKWKCCILRQ